MSGGRVYVHVDTESDGPDPAYNNMISIAVCMTSETGEVIGKFLGDLKPLEYYEPNPKTIKDFWERDDNNKAELKRIRENSRPAVEVMDDLLEYVHKIANGRECEWVAMPASYDWKWISYYHSVYMNDKEGDGRRIPFAVTCLSNLRTGYMLATDTKWDDMKVLWEEWRGDLKSTHNALDDAKSQARLFHKVQSELKGCAKLLKQRSNASFTKIKGIFVDLIIAYSIVKVVTYFTF